AGRIKCFFGSPSALPTRGPRAGAASRTRAPTRPKPRNQGGRQLMKVKPLYDRILVKRLEEEDKTSGGLIIPDTAKEKPVRGEVVAAGSGRRAKDGSVRALDVKKGDKILFEKWAGSEVKLDGVDHLILREEEVLGILD